MSLKSTKLTKSIGHNKFLSLAKIKTKSDDNRIKSTKYCQTAQLLREIKATDRLQQQVDKANVTELKNFKLYLQMEDAA